jgi:hypothetical protein
MLELTPEQRRAVHIEAVSNSLGVLADSLLVTHAEVINLTTLIELLIEKNIISEKDFTDKRQSILLDLEVYQVALAEKGNENEES